MNIKPTSPRPAHKETIPSSESDAFGRPERGYKRKLFTVIFEADTPAGKAFDVVLLLAIIASVLVVILGSVQSLGEHYQKLFIVLEWIHIPIYHRICCTVIVRGAARTLCAELFWHYRSDLDSADVSRPLLPKVSCADRYPLVAHAADI
ncbi:hypothetical protein BCL69_106121 [Nitrosomonas communis]|uniref:Voltage-gated potassium channel n=1 Tax=Nitrosomonas communis TaxID=44574 RepID=A0A5D3Y8J1_9PROT|nr:MULTISPECIES: hypothetical protein [Nitrosomonas]TYP80294.1 hypothetical protein BCL69_106121 [Nitrosomonas communis]UVS62836.1 hypothetical protein NX761_06945 [Nitrosomonas sp. PLL12]